MPTPGPRPGGATTQALSNSAASGAASGAAINDLIMRNRRCWRRIGPRTAGAVPEVPAALSELESFSGVSEQRAGRRAI